MSENSHAGSAGDARIGAGLTELTAAVRIVPAPLAEIITGGRRLRRRRNLLTGAAALTVTAVAAAVLVALPGLRPGGDGSVAPAAAPVLGGALPGSAPASPSASPGAARDPFQPVRTLVAEGTTDGKQWQAWAALWPLSTREQSFQQAQLIWQEQHAAGSDLSEPTPDYVARYWQPTTDIVDLYLVVDGARLPDDRLSDTPVPGTAEPLTTGPDGSLTGWLLGGGSDKSGKPKVLPVMMGAVRPDAAKVVVNWSNGTTSEPRLAPVGDSPLRWIAVAQPTGLHATSFKVFAADGRLLGTNKSWLNG
ncbi:hypothetical protein [Kitasatospora sp. NPDC087315]|uniref:hypothetical protein n=1 Tax=Kitasatospora sp. NPDC087315 TaxID=3364069 RepID=UPI00382EEA5F